MKALLTLALLFAAGSTSAEETEEAKAPIHEAGGDAKKRYFLIGPRDGVKAPEKGFKLLIVMPGGSGDAAFHPFIKNMVRHAVSEQWIVAQPIAVKWTDRQQIVWPTKSNPAKGAKFTTEEFIDAVVKDVAKRQKIDARYVFTLSWSSSGPAAYAIAFRKKTPITGSFIAMSVYFPKQLPKVPAVRGRAFYLFHSPDDAVCKFWMSRKANADLERMGAKTTLVEYAGGHGWHGNIFGSIRTGVDWLEKAVTD